MRSYQRWLRSLRTLDDVRAHRFIECPVAHPTWAVRREDIARLGYRDVGWPEDWDLLLRAFEANLRIWVVPKTLLAWRQNPNSHSRTHPRYSIEAFTRCRAAFLASGPLRDQQQFVLWGYGATGRALTAALAKHGRTPSHIIDVHPGRVGNTIHGAEVVAPSALGAIDAGPVLISVANARARRSIQAMLESLGRRDGILVA